MCRVGANSQKRDELSANNQDHEKRWTMYKVSNNDVICYWTAVDFFFLWLEFTFSQKIDHLLYKNKTKTVYATAVRSLSI